MNKTGKLRHRKLVSSIMGAIILLFSQPGYAHVRWFIADGTNPDVSLPFDGITILLSIVIVSLFMFAVLMTYRSPLPENLKLGLTQPVITSHPWLWYLLILIINCYLTINLLQGEFLAPNLYLSPQLALYGVMIQVAAIVLMAISVSLTGIAIVLTSISLFVIFPFFIAFDYFFEFFFVGLALVFIGPSLNKNDNRLLHLLHQSKEKLRRLAVHSLRLGLGLQLLELGVHNKLMLPGMALEFVNQNSYYNFFPLIQLPEVSNLHFVFFVGLSEVVIGFILALNLANRIIYGLLIAIFFTTFLLSGLEELVGHMPIFAIIFILFVEDGRQVTVSSSQTYLEEIESKES